MIQLKTRTEIDQMRPAGALVGNILATLRERTRPGISLTELDEIARDMLSDAGARSPFLGYHPHGVPRPFPASICTSVNDAVLHGIPTGYRLRDGDLLSIDCGAEVDGWVADAAISVAVGAARGDDLALVAAVEDALEAGIAAAGPGARIGDVSAAIAEIGRGRGYGINTDYGGHGVGHRMHEPPSVPNEGRAGRGLRLQEGLVIAIEPWFVASGSDAYRIDDDGWTIRSRDGSRTAHAEHTVAVTDEGPIVLTRHP